MDMCLYKVDIHEVRVAPNCFKSHTGSDTSWFFFLKFCLMFGLKFNLSDVTLFQQDNLSGQEEKVYNRPVWQLTKNSCILEIPGRTGTFSKANLYLVTHLFFCWWYVENVYYCTTCKSTFVKRLNVLYYCSTLHDSCGKFTFNSFSNCIYCIFSVRSGKESSMQSLYKMLIPIQARQLLCSSFWNG